MRCTSPVKLDSGVTVSCGQCRACRFARAREWATRIVHELPYWEASCFVTLTLSDEYLYSSERRVQGAPSSLDVGELQRFLKRLRARLSRRIRYYACGEYGDSTGRPHYHAILFGVSVSEHELGLPVKSCWECLSGPVVDAWNNGVERGFVSIGYVGFESALYVAKYVRKKLTGKMGKEAYEDKGLRPPFQVVSQKLGFRYAMDHADQIRDNLYVSMRGVRMAVNRYYREKLGITSEEVAENRHDALAERRKEDWTKFGDPENRALGLRMDLFDFEQGERRESIAASRDELLRRQGDDL